MSDVFISYARSDRPRAKVLAEALERNGWSTWWDRKIPLGKTWDEVIEKELDAARCVVVMWSKESVASDWVKTEAREAKQRGILIPVLIENVKTPLDFRHIQTANLVEWDPTANYPEFDRFLEELTGILGEPQSGKADRPRPANPDAKVESPKSTRPATAQAKFGSVEIEVGAERILRGHTKPVLSVAFAPDGQTLASGGGGVLAGDNTIRLWRLADGKLLRELKIHKNPVTSVVFSPDGAILASSSTEGICLWDMPDCKRLRTFEQNSVWAGKHLAFSPDGKILAADLDLLRALDGERLRSFAGPENRVMHDIAFSPEGDFLAGCNIDGLWLWRVVDGELLLKRLQKKAYVGSVAFSPDGTKLASGWTDNGRIIVFWSVPDGAKLLVLKDEGMNEPLGGGTSSVEFSPDGACLASSNPFQETVRLWRAGDGKLLSKLELPKKLFSPNGAHRVAFSSDSGWLAGACEDKLVRLWPLSRRVS
jgi:WD40 repeat protein